MANGSNLISVDELHSRLGAADVAVLDCRFDLRDPAAGRRMYLAGHIPGAVFANLDEDLSGPVGPDTGRHPLPAADFLAKTLGRLGISNASDVVVYDEGSGALAARAWWLLRWLGHDRVRLLNGGLGHWQAAAARLEVGNEPVAPQRFAGSLRSDQVLTTAELARDVPAVATMKLLDARDAARFRGEIEPIDAVAGHIPGSRNLPFGVSMQHDGTWKSQAELETLWTSVLGNDRQAPWAVMCGSGVTACHLAVSASEAGFSEPRLYAGSWSEWIRDPGRPVAVGDGCDGASGAADLE